MKKNMDVWTLSDQKLHGANKIDTGEYLKSEYCSDRGVFTLLLL